MTPNAYYVAAGGSNYNVYLFDRKGEFSWMHNPGYWVSSVSLSSNGSHLAAGSFDDRIYLFNLTGAKLWDYQVKDDVYAVEIAPDSSFIAAGSWDDSIYALNMSGKELWNCSCGGTSTAWMFHATVRPLLQGVKQEQYIYLNGTQPLLHCYPGMQVSCQKSL